MKGNLLVISAVGLFFAVAAFALLPSSAPAVRSSDSEPAAPSNTAIRTDGMPFIGVAMQIQKPDQLQNYIKAIDDIAADGADTVSLVVDSRQENGSSSRIFIDMRRTPTPEQLAELIRHAKSKKLRVILMPIVLLENPEGNEWRGTIHADNWDKWWDSYREMIYHYAFIAANDGVDVLVVGSELVSTERFSDEWNQTIRMVRRRFKGLLTYSSNWDHYTSVPFWDKLDFIGMNSYYKLGNDHNVTVDQIVNRWHDIQKDLFRFQRKSGKPLILLEAGWCSLSNAADKPWDYTIESVPIDLELQRKLYDGFFQAWWGVPQSGGFVMWEWPPGEGGPDDRGYAPRNKPAERVMKEWFAKPRWTVHP